METTAAQAEVLDDAVDFLRLLCAVQRRLLADDKVEIHVGVNEMVIDRPTHRTSDACRQGERNKLLKCIAIQQPVRNVSRWVQCRTT